jgi:hypothetical protein
MNKFYYSQNKFNYFIFYFKALEMMEEKDSEHYDSEDADEVMEADDVSTD